MQESDNWPMSCMAIRDSLPTLTSLAQLDRLKTVAWALDAYHEVRLGAQKSGDMTRGLHQMLHSNVIVHGCQVKTGGNELPFTIEFNPGT